MKKYIVLLLLAIVELSGCAVNPVTGRQELALVSEAQEISAGQEQYNPSRQMQGGDYVVDPALTQYVDRVGKKLAAVSDRKLPYEFKVINNSTPNAWSLPGGKIAVNRGMLTELSNEAELSAVLSHEMVHAAARHGAKAMERGMLLQGAMAAAGIAMSDSRYANLGIMGSSLAASLVNQKYSRDAERESDMYGMEYMARAGYNPNAAVSLQEVFVRLSENRDQNWLNGLFSSHPPSMERVVANREKALQLGTAGTFGEETYRQMTAHLKKTKEGYKAYDQGVKAISQGKTREALSLAEKALKIEPREGLFHALKGDVQFSQKNYRESLIQYNQAVELNPAFFQFFLQRGLAREKLGEVTAARADLEKSVGLLPTATGYKALGDIALAQGDRQNAVRYYEAASGSSSAAGKSAQGALVRMDLPQRPDRYLNARTGLGKDGRVYAQMINQTSVPIKNIRMKARFRDSAGRVQEIPFAFMQTLYPGKTVTIPIGTGQFKNPAALNNVDVSIVGAEIAE